MIREFAVLLWIFVSGTVVGILFDFYRIVRWRMRLNRYLTFIGDIFFSLLALIIVFLFAQKANYLEMRFYIFGGSLLGLVVYLRLFSNVFKKVFLELINFIISLEKTITKGFYCLYLLIRNTLVFLMRFPYGLLRWFALLLYRILEVFIGNSVSNINKFSKSKIHQIVSKIKQIQQLFRKK